MKKLLTLILMLATLLTFSACEDKNEPESNIKPDETQTDDLVGSTWVYKNVGDYMVGINTFIEFDEKNVYSYMNNFNGFISWASPTYSKYTREGNIITINPPLSLFFDGHTEIYSAETWGITRLELIDETLRVYWQHYKRFGAELIYVGEEYVNFRKQQ